MADRRITSACLNVDSPGSVKLRGVAKETTFSRELVVSGKRAV